VEPIRVGIIGFGMMGRMQALGCFGALADDFRLAAVCDDHTPHLAAARELFGPDVRYFPDYRRMLDECDFDLAAVVTPDFLHEEMATACLRAGRHLRLEKPMALDPGGCARVIEAAEKAGTVVQIGLELRYAELVGRMRERREVLGRLKMLWCHEFRHPFLAKPGSVPDWIVRREYSGGTLIEKCCHHFDLFNDFAGARPASVYAVGDHEVQYAHTDVLDNAFATVEYENGTRANLSLCMFAPPAEGRPGLSTLDFGLLGDSGRMELRGDELSVWDRGRPGVESYRHERVDLVGHDDEIVPSLRDLVRCIRTCGTPDADLRAGLSSVMTAWAAEESVRLGRPVEMREVEERFEVDYPA